MQGLVVELKELVNRKAEVMYNFCMSIPCKECPFNISKTKYVVCWYLATNKMIKKFEDDSM